MQRNGDSRLKGHDLSEGVHSGIRPARSPYPRRPVVDPSQSVFQSTLDGRLLALALKPMELRTIVRDG